MNPLSLANNINIPSVNTQAPLPLAGQTSNPVEDLYAPVQPYLETVKQKIQTIVPPESQLLAESLHHSLAPGGKLLRPVLTLLMAGATTECTTGKSGAITDAHLETAAVSEMIHTATLLHDDVLDEADLRRNKKTARAIWGNAVSILSGDYLLAQASRKLAQIGNIRVVGIFSNVLADLCDGEVEQIRTSYRLSATSWESYYRKSICKTASLFAASCEAAGVLNGLPEDHIQELAEFGKHLGIAFQIMDDLLDVTQDEATLGKPAMGDLTNGLLTAPVLLALESTELTTAEQQALKTNIEALFKLDTDLNTPDSALYLSVIRQLMEKSGAVAQTQTLAKDYVERSWANLVWVPPSVFKDSLMGLGQFVIERTY